VPGFNPVRVLEQLHKQRIALMNRSPLLDSRQHRRDVRLQQPCDPGVLRFSDGFDAVLSRDNLSVDFRSVLEELVKHLHVCSMCTIAHHAVASTSTLSERGRDGDQSDEQHLNNKSQFLRHSTYSRALL
jgi:hypothetical protein